jgi:tRNA threonylcarbamoyl adenosine modification protein YeaZ
MKILALELSTARGSLAWLDGNLQDVREWPNDRKDSADFFRNLEAVTGKFASPEIIIVGLGPGSYAGTRIAVSAAIGLQLSSNARLIGFPSICAIDCETNEYCVIGDARRKSFFFARVRDRALTEGPALCSEAEMKKKLHKTESTIPIFCSESLPQFQRAVIRYPSAVVLCRVAQEAGSGLFLPPLEPIYLREPHITMPK